MNKKGEVEERTKTITGKGLSFLLGVKPRDYVNLYPRKRTSGYCACNDLEMGEENKKICHGMDTVMKILTSSEIKDFPEGTVKVSNGPYKSGEVYINEEYNIAYLYVGRDSLGRDVAINLGGETFNKGGVEIGHINSNKAGRISFDRKVFPK
jgi:hypothetical protein